MKKTGLRVAILAVCAMLAASAQAFQVSESFQFPGKALLQAGNAKRTAEIARLSYEAAVPRLPFRPPVVLIVGTSMSAGKTMTARLAIRLLKEAGLKVPS